MKHFHTLILLLHSFACLAQPWYSKVVDPFDGRHKNIQDIISRNSYIPIVTHTNEWVVDYKPPHGFPAEVRRYTFPSDSVLLGGKHYRQLIHSNNMSGGPWVQHNEYYRE